MQFCDNWDDEVDGAGTPCPIGWWACDYKRPEEWPTTTTQKPGQETTSFYNNVTDLRVFEPVPYTLVVGSMGSLIGFSLCVLSVPCIKNRRGNLEGAGTDVVALEGEDAEATGGSRRGNRQQMVRKVSVIGNLWDSGPRLSLSERFFMRCCGCLRRGGVAGNEVTAIDSTMQKSVTADSGVQASRSERLSCMLMDDSPPPDDIEFQSKSGHSAPQTLPGNPWMVRTLTKEERDAAEIPAEVAETIVFDEDGNAMKQSEAVADEEVRSERSRPSKLSAGVPEPQTAPVLLLPEPADVKAPPPRLIWQVPLPTPLNPPPFIPNGSFKQFLKDSTLDHSQKPLIEARQKKPAVAAPSSSPSSRRRVAEMRAIAMETSLNGESSHPASPSLNRVCGHSPNGEKSQGGRKSPSPSSPTSQSSRKLASPGHPSSKRGRDLA